jgi:hypothetical protein
MQLFFLALLELVTIEVVFAAHEGTILGTGAPPATFHGWTMTAVPSDTRATSVSYWSVEGLGAGDPIQFNPQVIHYEVPTSWATWSHGYTGDVYYSNGVTVAITFPQDTCAFIFYAEPNNFDPHTMTIEYASGYIITQAVVGQSGAYGFAITYDIEYGAPTSVTVSAPAAAAGFAVGEFYMSQCGPDTDGDSVPDLVDNCPNDANAGQCDYDGDGVGDACDLCILGANDVDRDNDGVPDACDKCPGFDDNIDADGDGIPDACDICPEPMRGDNYADADGDGIPDCIDNCINVANADQADIDADGKGDVCDHDQACCVNDCSVVPDGYYQSCQGCTVYATCAAGGQLYDNRPCPEGLFWDDNVRGCVWISSTCDPTGMVQSIPCH